MSQDSTVSEDTILLSTDLLLNGPTAKDKPNRPDQRKQRGIRRGVHKPKLPVSKKGWAAIHREARRRAAVYYRMKALEEQLASFDMEQRLGGGVRGSDARHNHPTVYLLPLHLMPPNGLKPIPRGP